jgi:hypothetical protein
MALPVDGRHGRCYGSPVPNKPSARSTVPPSLSEVMRWVGARGAKAGGKARWEGVSAKDRAAHARRMVAAREAKRAAKKKPPLKKPPLGAR